MKLNLQILELELADICLESRYLNDRLDRRLRFPVLAGEICHPDPSVLYLLQKDSEIVFPDNKICSFVCIGQVPETVRAAQCSWLCVSGDIDLHTMILRLHEIFERYNNWELSMLEAIAEKKPIKQLGILAKPFLRHPFQLYDPEILCIFSIVDDAYYSLPSGYEVQTDRKYLNPEDITTLLLSNSYVEAITEQTPVLFEPGYFPIRAMSRSLHLSDKFVGTLMVDEVGAPFRDGDFAVLHYIGFIFERYLQHNNILSLGRPFEFEEIMSTILQHRFVEESKLNQFLDSLEFRPRDSFFCIVVSSTNTKEARNTLSLLSIQVSQATQSKCYLEFDGKLVFVLRITPNANREQLLQTILPILREYFVQCGISLPFQDFRNLYVYYWQCLRALELGKEKNPTYWFYRFENYMLEHLLQASHASLCPEIMIPEGLGRLIAYDTENGTQFVEILKTYLDNHMSLTAAAKALYVHKNTLLYRIEKIKEILQMNLEDPDIRLLLSVALRILMR